MDRDLPRSVAYRRRAKEILDLAETMSGPARDELVRNALRWELLADKADEEQSGHQDEDHSR